MPVLERHVRALLGNELPLLTEAHDDLVSSKSVNTMTLFLLSTSSHSIVVTYHREGRMSVQSQHKKKTQYDQKEAQNDQDKM